MTDQLTENGSIQAKNQMTETTASKGRILVVDDSYDMVRLLANTLLPNYGFRSSYALDGRTALDKIRHEKPDLIILDLNLPQMTGLDVLEALAQENITTPVVLITGDGSEKSAVEAFRLGVKDYIVKPFTVEEVINTIERALGLSTTQNNEAALTERLFVAHNNIRQLHTRIKQLLQISTTLTALTDRDTIVVEALRNAVAQCGAGDAQLFLRSDKTDIVQIILRSDEMQPRVRKSAQHNPYVQNVLDDGQVFRHHDFIQGVDLSGNSKIRSLLYAPVKYKDDVLGVLCVHHYQAPRTFSEQDEIFMSVLGLFTGIALHNAEEIGLARRHRQQQHEALVRIVHAASRQAPAAQLLTDVVAAVYRSNPVEACRLWLPDAQTGMMTCVADVGVSAESREGEAVSADDGMITQVAGSGQWAYRNEASEETAPVVAEETNSIVTRSMLCVPLLFQDTITGVLQLLNKSDGTFDETDVAHAQELAAAVAVAVVTITGSA